MKWWVRSIILSVVLLALVIGACIVHTSVILKGKLTAKQDERISELYGQVCGFGLVAIWVITWLIERSAGSFDCRRKGPSEADAEFSMSPSPAYAFRSAAAVSAVAGASTSVATKTRFRSSAKGTYFPLADAMSDPSTRLISLVVVINFDRACSMCAVAVSGTPTAADSLNRTVNSPQTQKRLPDQVAAQTMASSRTVARIPPWMMPSKPIWFGVGVKVVVTMPVAGLTCRER